MRSCGVGRTGFGVHALVEPREVHNRARVCALADFFGIVPRFYVKDELASIHLDKLCTGADGHSNRRCGEVFDVYGNANGGLPFR